MPKHIPTLELDKKWDLPLFSQLTIALVGLTQLSIAMSYHTGKAVLHIGIFILAIGTATYLHHIILRHQKHLMKEQFRQLRRKVVLDHFEAWKRIACKLSHEIRNPLTPISMAIGNLVRNHIYSDKEQFRHQLLESYAVVNEELKKIGVLIGRFSDYTKMPPSDPSPVSVCRFMEEFISSQEKNYPALLVDFSATEKTQHIKANIDTGLFSLCLENILQNISEANPTTWPIKVSISLSCNISNLILMIHNIGTAIDRQDISKVFDMYFTTKTENHNMGMGLAIAQKIVFEHDGDITCLSDASGVTVCITIPFLSSI